MEPKKIFNSVFIGILLPWSNKCYKPQSCGVLGKSENFAIVNYLAIIFTLGSRQSFHPILNTLGRRYIQFRMVDYFYNPRSHFGVIPNDTTQEK